MSECVKVVVRCRPMNNREKELHCKSVVYMDSSLCQCSIVNPSDASAPPKTFSFDGVYFTDSTTEAIYNDVAYPLVEGVLEGYNSTVFAYGQTGCGKSYTMQGVPTPPAHKGIIPRAFEHIFEAIETSEGRKFLVHASYLEIYNEEIRDLLGKDAKKKMELKETPDKGIYVPDLSLHAVHNVEECEALMEKGWRNRAVGSTLMNADSSRSHSIFTINVETLDDCEHIRQGKLNLVDLAGSERQSKTGATGDRLKEATKINLSLSALGNVISALVDGKSKHIPYRDSKLTRLLQDSLGGNTKTLMVACVSPADNNYDETLSTLRYANRAKNIKNKPRINQDPKDALLSEYQQEILQLKRLLEQKGPLVGLGQEGPDIEALEAEKEKIRREYESQIQQLKQSYETEKGQRAQLEQHVETLKEKYQKESKNLQKRRNSQQVATSGGGGNLTTEQQEALQRLQMIEENMVGGEKANDKALLEKREKKKKAAEKRLKALQDTLDKTGAAGDEDDMLLIKAYDNIQEELRAKTDALKKAKQKIRALEREVSDLYSEFQYDRTDYLETIRRQDQQLKLLQAILDKIQPTIRRDCNYSNVESIKSEAVWIDETQRWKLPDLTVVKTKLPPAALNGVGGSNHNNDPSIPSLGGGMQNGTHSVNGRVSSKTAPASLTFDNDEDHEGDGNGRSVLFKKFENSDHLEGFAENYFKPKRATELIIKAQQDANRVSNLAQKITNGNTLSNNWNNNNNNYYNNSNSKNKNASGGGGQNHSWGPSPVQMNGWMSSSGGSSGLSGFLSSPEMNTSSPPRRPTKLEALPLDKPMKKLKPTEFAQHA